MNDQNLLQPLQQNSSNEATTENPELKTLRKIPDSLKTLTVADLAQILHKSEASIMSDLKRNPECLPPVLRIKRSKRPLWRLNEVEKWLEDQVE